MEEDLISGGEISEVDSDISSGSEESSHAGRAAIPPTPGRISLGSVFIGSSSPLPLDNEYQSPARQQRGSPANRAASPVSVHSGPARSEEVAEWFHGRHVPDEKMDVLSWHPNRVQGLVVAELHSKLNNLKPRRSRHKCFDPVTAMQDLVEMRHAVPLGNATWRERLNAKDLYTRVLNMITGVHVRELKKMVARKWSEYDIDGKNQWCVLHRIIHHGRVAPLIRFPNRSGMAEMEKAEQNQKKKHDCKTITWTGYGFVLSYNTDLGQEDPDVIKTVHSGKVGEELLKAMRGLEIYQEAFTDLWDHANALGTSKRLPTVNVGMEHSTHGDHEARVHFHVFVGPDIRGGVGFGWTPVLVELTNQEVMWRGIAPNVKPTKPQKKSGNQIYQAVATGSYYVAGPKIGTIMKRSTYQPIQDQLLHCVSS